MDSSFRQQAPFCRSVILSFLVQNLTIPDWTSGGAVTQAPVSFCHSSLLFEALSFCLFFSEGFLVEGAWPLETKIWLLAGSAPLPTLHLGLLGAQRWGRTPVPACIHACTLTHISL